MENINSTIVDLISKVSNERLYKYISAIEGLRHGWENYNEVEKRASFIEDTFRSFSLSVENQYLLFHGRKYRNIAATLHSINNSNSNEYILLGAHYDAAWGSPGADDNASGIAVLLESARLLSKYNFKINIEFVAFTLEEPQPQTIHFLIGSDHFARNSKKLNKKYKAVFILESVGYTDNSEGSQIVPLFVRIPVPRTGNFLGVIANRKSNFLMNNFYQIAKSYVPELSVITYKVPLSGRLIPETRFSDHASFWNYGYPAVMLTDTAMFRNPHYHTFHDKKETLDFNFISLVAKSVISTLMIMGNQ
ncbi:MAG: M28 family peptidase [Nitrospirae bacterium]|nr:M28 family peptidase [Nitrospirota bacterium]